VGFYVWGIIFIYKNMIKLTTLLKEIQGNIIDNLIKQVDPTIKQMVQTAKEEALKKDEKFTKLDEEYYYWMLLSDMVRSFEQYTLPTDKLINFEIRGSVKGSLIINATIERDGKEYPLYTEVIYAGGSNIQRLHYRYLTKTSLPKQPLTPEANAIKAKLKGMSKVQKYQDEIAQFEKRIEAAEEKIAIANSMKSDDDIKKYIFSHPEESKKIYHHAIDNPQEFEKFYGQDDDWKERWMVRYRNWPTRDIKNLKTAIAKLQAKIDKEQL
jgi:hypothetical protein